MPPSKPAELTPYHYHQEQEEVNYVVLPFYILPESFRRRKQRRCRLISAAAFLLLLSLSLYSLWPSEPYLNLSRLRLHRIHIHTVPSISVDVALNLTVNVRNVDLFSIDYNSIVVSIGYRGKQLGLVTSDRGYVRPRGSSYVNATLELEGVEVLSDVILLLEDLARGSIAFDTVTEFHGKLGFFFFDVTLKAKVSCEVHVNTRNQTIIRQNCYPEVRLSFYFKKNY
ncbi:hypothetical protein CsSME_00052289 [Camellia sinensis var. sinensis]